MRTAILEAPDANRLLSALAPDELRRVAAALRLQFLPRAAQRRRGLARQLEQAGAARSRGELPITDGAALERGSCDRCRDLSQDFETLSAVCDKYRARNTTVSFGAELRLDFP